MSKPELFMYIPGLPQRIDEYRRGDSILVYDGKKHAVLIDGGEKELFDRMRAKMKVLGIQHVTFILTHWHGDHYCGLRSALNDPYIIVDEIYCPDPEELKLIPKDDGYNERTAAYKVLSLAKELKKKIVYPAANKKSGHWVGDIRIWMWRQKANPNDFVDFQLNNTSIQVYFPDLQHLETGDAISSANRFLKAYNWPITTFSCNHHGNGNNAIVCKLYEEHGAKLCWYSDWEPIGVPIGGTHFSKYGAGRAREQGFIVLRPFEDIYVTADGKGHVTWKQGSKSKAFDIAYGAEPKTAIKDIPPKDVKIEVIPKLRDMKEMFGPDVSFAQGKIDWDKLAPHIDFAIIQCGFGQDLKSQDDKQFRRNVAECERLGIPYGLYLYSYAGNTTRAGGEADHMLRLAAECHPSLPLYYDLEESSLGGAAAGNMGVWGQKVESKGYWAGLYTGEYFCNANLNTINRFTKWIAKYGSNTGRMGNKPNVSNIAIWQYTSRAQLPGISDHVDMNVMHEDLIKAVTGKDYIQAARDVWAGKYGTGLERNVKLEEAGFDRRIVQHLVNRLVAN